MNIVCVIQARLGSTRLPGKVLLPLAGKSMLENIIERVQRAKLVDEICIAGPCNESVIIQECRRVRIPWYEAAHDIFEDDLIRRFFGAAEHFEADVIVRISSDNPCVEPEAIDWLCDHAKALPEKCRILKLNSENFLGDHDGFGGELYTLEMLEWMDRTIKDPEYREHPHKFWRDMNAWIYVGKDYPRGFRLDVNTQADYEKLKDIYDHFGHNRFTVREVMEYLGMKEKRYNAMEDSW